MMGNYERVIEKISRISNVSKEEIERKIEAKRAKLSGLISREGAAQVIAAELGISFDNEILKIEELLPGMKKVNILAKVVNISPVKTFKTKKGDDGKVANLFVADETSNIKIVLWDTHHIDLIETGDLKVGHVVEVSNGSMRDNELHLGSFSGLKLSDSVINDVMTDKIFRRRNLSELGNSESAQVRVFVVQCFEPKFFYVCPECKKKVIQEGNGFVCNEHGKVKEEKRALATLVLDDGTETMKAVVFHENLKPIGINEFDNKEELFRQKDDVIGREMIIQGTVRMNKLFNIPELIVEQIEPVNADLLINELEKN